MCSNLRETKVKLGITDIYQVQFGKLRANTILAKIGEKDLTVSDLLNSITDLLSFIKCHFNVNERKYSITIIFLDSMRLALNNHRANKPSKEDMHVVIDVFHEITNLCSENIEQKRKNEEITMALDYLVEILS